MSDKLIFPTGKKHISYSELSDWIECSHRHFLKHIKHIQLDSGSIHTAFGSTVHNCIEKYLSTKKMPSGEEAIEQFRSLFSELEPEVKEKAMEDVGEFEENLPDMIGQVPDWLDETFPGWEPVASEHRLYEQIEKQPICFKGYIDAVIRIPKKRSKKQIRLETLKGQDATQEYIYHILDWKTAGWGWKADQKRKFEKQLQLILYKYFYCLYAGLPMKDTRCGFVLIKRIPPRKKRTPGDRLELVTVSVGPKAIDKGLEVMHNMINQVKQGRAMKNRRHCEPFCMFKNTKYCL